MQNAKNTMARVNKGSIVAPPKLPSELAAVAEEVSKWTGVIATGHWTFYKPRSIDGVDFYVGESELGHIHLDGDIHLATNSTLGDELIGLGHARPFRYQEGWVHEYVSRIGAPAAIELFRRNYTAITTGEQVTPSQSAV